MSRTGRRFGSLTMSTLISTALGFKQKIANSVAFRRLFNFIQNQLATNGVILFIRHHWQRAWGILQPLGLKASRLLRSWWFHARRHQKNPFTRPLSMPANPPLHRPSAPAQSHVEESIEAESQQVADTLRQALQGNPFDSIRFDSRF